MMTLPKELWLLIFEEVPPENAANIARTCKVWRDLISFMWSRWSKRYFPWHQKLPTYEPKLLIEGEINWKTNKYTVKDLYKHKDGVRCVRLTPERLYRCTFHCNTLLPTQHSGGNDRKIVATNLATEKVEWTTNTKTQCTTMELENERIFVGQNDSRVCIFNTTDGSKVHELTVSDAFSDRVYHIGLTHKYLITSSSSHFCVFDKNTLQLIHTTQHEFGRGRGLSVNDRFIAYGTKTCTYLLGHDSLEVVGTMGIKNQHSLQFVDEELLSNENCEILFWDIRNFSQKHRIRVSGYEYPFSVTFVYDKVKLVVDWTGAQGTKSQIQKVNPNSGEILHTYQLEHANSFFDMDPTRLVVGSNALANNVTLVNFTRLQHN